MTDPTHSGEMAAEESVRHLTLRPASSQAGVCRVDGMLLVRICPLEVRATVTPSRSPGGDGTPGREKGRSEAHQDHLRRIWFVL